MTTTNLTLFDPVESRHPMWTPPASELEIGFARRRYRRCLAGNLTRFDRPGFAQVIGFCERAYALTTVHEADNGTWLSGAVTLLRIATVRDLTAPMPSVDRATKEQLTRAVRVIADLTERLILSTTGQDTTPTTEDLT